MRPILLAVCVALGSSVAFAGTDGTATKGGPDEFWQQHQKSGVMSMDDAMTYKGPDGSTIDMKLMDKNGDGKISQDEWKAYKFNKDATKSDGAPKGTPQ